MTTLRLSGPIDLPVPNDPDPWPGLDWQALFDSGTAHVHQDSQDRLNADKTWGTDDTQAPGGSGIAFAYSQPDIAAVRVACHGWQNNPVKPNVEHQIRDGLYAMEGWDRTKDVYFARRVQAIAARGTTWPWFSEHGDVSLNDPGNRPQNLDNLMASAQSRPHQGLRWVNLRAFGQTMWMKACEHKCARGLGSAIDPTWMRRALDILELAAYPGTGQLGYGEKGDSQHPLDQDGCEYLFHWGMAAMGAMACAHRVHRPIPSWVIPHLHAVAALPTIEEWGWPSPFAFTYTQGDHLVIATGSGQQADPAFGWLSSVAVAAAKMTGDKLLLNFCTRWGPTVWDGQDEQGRKFTMLWRGATS